MVEYHPVATYLKSDPDLYCGIKYAANRLKIEEIVHIKGHQDQSGRTLRNIKKLNVIVDKLATKVVNEEKSNEPEWHASFGPMLKIAGKVITQKEGLNLGITAEIEELHEWQSNKLNMNHGDYQKIDWATQLATMAKLPRKTHRFVVHFVYHWLPSGRRITISTMRINALCAENPMKHRHTS